MPICKKCNEKFPNRKKIEGKIRTLNSRKYCLDCSPWGEHNTRKIHLPKQGCTQCGEADISKFYGHRKNMCASCFNKYTTERGNRIRLQAINHLGGKCVSCGYNKYMSSLDVHHLDPNKKDKNFKSMRGWCWERLVKELESCTLLCKNCHTPVHTGELELE